MSTSLSIHNIRKVIVSKSHVIGGCSYTNEIVIIDGKGNKVEINLFSPEKKFLKIIQSKKEFIGAEAVEFIHEHKLGASK